MLDIGFSELLLIAIVALVVIGPKDLPVVLKHVAGFLREMRGLYAGVKRQMHEVMDEAGINDFHRQMTTIIDLNGTPQQAYDVNELSTLSQNPSPQKGDDGKGAVPDSEPETMPIATPMPPKQP